MTTTSEAPNPPAKAERPILYRKGDYLVTVIRIKDERIAETGGFRLEFGLVHVPTGVLVSTGSMLAGMIRAAYALDEEVKDAKAHPEKLHEQLQEMKQDFSGPGRDGFQF